MNGLAMATERGHWCGDVLIVNRANPNGYGSALENDCDRGAA